MQATHLIIDCVNWNSTKKKNSKLVIFLCWFSREKQLSNQNQLNNLKKKKNNYQKIATFANGAKEFVSGACTIDHNTVVVGRCGCCLQSRLAHGAYEQRVDYEGKATTK